MKTTVAENASFRHARNVAWRRVDDQVVVLDLDTSLYFSLNESAAFLWESLVDGAPVTELRRKLRAEFDGVPAKADAELDAFIRELLDERLLEPAG